MNLYPMRSGGTAQRKPKKSVFSNLCLLGCVIIMFWLSVLMYALHNGYDYSFDSQLVVFMNK